MLAGDRKVLKLIRAMLGSAVLEGTTVRHSVTGTPQGGVISPLMCNVYLNRLDRIWEGEHGGRLVRYADDLLVICKSRSEAERALRRLGEILAEMGLELKAAKTRIVKLEVGGEGVDFLGFHHRLVRARGRQGTKRVTFLARWPSRRALQHARERIRQLTDRSRLLVPFEQVVAEVNRFLRGWAGYFRIGNSARMFDKIMTHAIDRICLFLAKLHKRHRRYGWAMLRLSPDRLGLITLEGTVVSPRPNRAWRALVAEHRR